MLLLRDLQSQLLCRQGSVLILMGCECPVAARSRGPRLPMVADGLSHTSLGYVQQVYIFFSAAFLFSCSNLNMLVVLSWLCNVFNTLPSWCPLLPHGLVVHLPLMRVQ